MTNSDAYSGDAPVSTLKSRAGSAANKEAAQDRDWSIASIVGRTITVNRPRQDVYKVWRDFSAFPSFMENIEQVTQLDDKRLHWVVAAPGGTTVEWDVVITEDTPGEVIVWESVKGSGINNTGRVEFKDAPAGRGTEVTATIVYEPPGGDIGRLIAKLFRREPKIQVRQDMRRFKQLMEAGEVSTARRYRISPQAN
ncbi:MAG: SRPBCC family protein [Hyphomicrobiales bacterium]|nr:SRPBCC family protein [Hyphomicrobiales bacterium]